MNHVCTRLGVSERRACRVMGHARSTHRHLARLPDDEPRLVSRMIELATTYSFTIAVTGRRSASRSIITICSSVNRLLFMAPTDPEEAIRSKVGWTASGSLWIVILPTYCRTSESVVFEWIQEIDPELVKIAHVAGHDRQPMHQGRRGDHGILQQGV